MSAFTEKFGRYGIWSLELRHGEPALAQDAAAELEQLGFKTIWIPGSAGADVLVRAEELLAATQHITIATGIINIWRNSAEEVGAWWRALPKVYKPRVLLGLGVSHARLIGDRYGPPLTSMKAYLDVLDKEGVPVEQRCLAALGPKMQELAAARTLGAHPYLITPEHTAEARQRIGPKALLAPEQGVILQNDPKQAYADARAALEIYLRLENYLNNWRRLGFTDDDFANGGSDRLCDAMFPWGSTDKIKARCEAHFAAGADHVCLQVVGAGFDRSHVEPRRPAWRALANALL
jgi:probable F420-dependent oxidoreductase